MSERFSSFDRLVVPGGTKQEKEELLGEMGMDLMSRGGELMEGELEKTPEQVAICNLISEMTDTVLIKNGRTPLSVPLENIHVFPGELTSGGLDVGGKYFPSNQFVIVRAAGSNVEFAQYVCHELLHFKSYGAVQVTSGGEVDYSYRSGFTTNTRDGSRDFFHRIDEALTEELTKKVIIELKNTSNPLFDEENRTTDEIQTEYGQREGAAGAFFGGDDIVYARYLAISDPEYIEGNRVRAMDYAYPRERKALYTLIDKILERNPGKFNGRDELFDFFVKGKLQGNYLAIGRIIDQSFGMGSFRMIGEASSGDIETYEKCVEAL